MAAATQRAPSADANISGSGGKGRRTSQSLKGRRGSGVEKMDTHVSRMEEKKGVMRQPFPQLMSLF